MARNLKKFYDYETETWMNVFERHNKKFTDVDFLETEIVFKDIKEVYFNTNIEDFKSYWQANIETIDINEQVLMVHLADDIWYDLFDKILDYLLALNVAIKMLNKHIIVYWQVDGGSYEEKTVDEVALLYYEFFK